MVDEAEYFAKKAIRNLQVRTGKSVRLAQHMLAALHASRQDRFATKIELLVRLLNRHCWTLGDKSDMKHFFLTVLDGNAAISFGWELLVRNEELLKIRKNQLGGAD